MFYVESDTILRGWILSTWFVNLLRKSWATDMLFMRWATARVSWREIRPRSFFPFFKVRTWSVASSHHKQLKVTCFAISFSGPGPPSRVRFTSVSRETVTIAWDPPVYPRGVIQGYKAACRLNTSSASDPYVWQSTMGRNDLRRTAGPLNPQSFYRFYLWALTNTSQSENPAEAVVYTGGSTGLYILVIHLLVWERYPMSSALESRSKDPRLRPGPGQWFVFLGNTLHSHSDSPSRR